MEQSSEYKFDRFIICNFNFLVFVVLATEDSLIPDIVHDDSILAWKMF